MHKINQTQFLICQSFDDGGKFGMYVAHKLVSLWVRGLSHLIAPRKPSVTEEDIRPFTNDVKKY